MSVPETLAAALAEFQRNLPAVLKDAKAKVPTKTGGSYEYSYAGLPQVSSAVLPLLGALGLSFTAKPTLNDAGKFVLSYKLLHSSGEHEAGEYPLPQSGTPQEFGSAITYARRYALCSITGVTPEDDDDGAAASSRSMSVDHRREPEPVEKAATAAQTSKYDLLAKTLAAAESQKALREAWDQIVAAFKADEVTTSQANLLRSDLETRKAEVAS